MLGLFLSAMYVSLYFLSFTVFQSEPWFLFYLQICMLVFI